MSDDKAKKHGMLAFFVGIINLISGCYFTRVRSLNFLFPLIFLWITPFFIVNNIEKRNLASLGFKLNKGKAKEYIQYTLLGFIVLTALLMIEHYIIKIVQIDSQNRIFIQDSSLLAQLMIQIGGIGLPEELFFRGYLLIRFREWLGQTKGLFLSSLFFGLGHSLSRIIEYGSGYWVYSSVMGISTLLGGLVLGYLLIKSRCLLVPASSHILLNIFGVAVSNFFIT
ncbi:MAG: CPBP family intramembrane metalloprotease [Asgard group archaeon]|nr:CPBP family intramembrane metalloprotease [Asgard group archaeon]